MHVDCGKKRIWVSVPGKLDEKAGYKEPADELLHSEKIQELGWSAGEGSIRSIYSSTDL